MNPAPVLTAAPRAADSARSRQYTRIAYGAGSPDPYLQVVGLGADQDAGQAIVASMQNPPGSPTLWQPAGQTLAAPVPLTDLVVCSDMVATDAVGLGNDGAIYVVGTQTQDAVWSPGPGRITLSPTFLPGSLSACLLNTSTVFAVTSAQAPCVAAQRSQQADNAWRGGYALPLPATGRTTYQWLGARPDVSDRGVTHAIGLTSAGQACEVATSAGSGTGPGNWLAGHGLLGNAGGLPVFTRLLLVSGDAKGAFHVIGVASDGSVWDIDQYQTSGAGGWTGRSQLIAPSGIVRGAGNKIECYLTTDADGVVLNLVCQTMSTLVCFAKNSAGAWVPQNFGIPVLGGCSEWQIVTNLTAGAGPEVFILGLRGWGPVYQLASFSQGAWRAGPPAPISQ